MKFKFPLVLLSGALLLGCGGTPTGGTDPGSQQTQKVLITISVTNPTKSSYEVGDTISLSGMVVTAYYSDGSTETIPLSSCTVVTPSTATSGTKTITVTYNGKTATVVIYVTSSGQGGDPVDPVDPTDPADPEDLDGYVAIAEAPEGVTLTDWTDAMKEIFQTYLAGIIPPFFNLEELRVTYDNLDILQVRGVAYDGVLQEYCDFLNTQQGYQAYIDNDNAGRGHVYARALSMDLVPVLISVDALVGNGYITINFDKDIATSSWPSDGIAQVCSEEYESIYTVPAYVSDGVSYIIEEDIMSNLNILCLGASTDSVSEYKTILESNSYKVQEMETAGMYTALSRDSKIIIVFYYDGYGLMIMATHGEGEKYTTWEECFWAIDDFAKVELRHAEPISSLIPAIPEAVTYEIIRSTANGRLEIVAHKDSSFSQKDLNLYRNACSEAGFDVDDIKDSERIWILPKDKSYAMFVSLNDYISDLGEVFSDFALDICDYRLYEGYNVKYGEWPTLQVNTINNNINRDAVIPGYEKSDAIYYVKSDYRQHIEMDLVNPGTTCLTDYKAGLEEYGYTVKVVEGVYTAVDSTKSIQLTFYMKGEEMHIAIDIYVEDTYSEIEANITFLNKSNIASVDTYYETVVWQNGVASFKVEKATSANYVADGGDSAYIQNPLRIYKNQKITISATGKQLTKISFTVADVTMGNGSPAKGFDRSYFLNLTIDGLTQESYNSATGIATYIVNSGYEGGVEFVASLGHFGLKNVKISYK